MTSANSSLARLIKEQKALLVRRLPLAALSIIMYFLYDVFGTFMVLQRERSVFDADIFFSTRGVNAVSALMGISSMGWFIGCVGAVLLAIQGFSYLYKTQTVDFYESRPEKRSTRFFNIIINGVLIYLIPSLLGVILSYIIAVLYGCGPAWLLSEMLLSYLFQTLLFLATLGMSTLAALLTGTVVTAVLMNAFFFGLEALIRLTILGYRGAFYATFDMSHIDNLLSNIYTLPAFNYLEGIVKLNINMFSESNSKASMDFVMKAFEYCTKGSIVNLAIFAVTIILSFIVYQKRKAENAGKAVIYRPLEVFIKFILGVFFSLDAGLTAYWLFNSDGSLSSLVFVIITIILSAFLWSIILESIFACNVRKAFNKAVHIPVIAAIAIAILFIYNSGITGYDRYLPGENEVSSAWLVNNNYNADYYDDSDNYMPTSDYVEKNMFLTDTADLLELAAIGQSESVRIRNTKNDVNATLDYWDAVIGWRLKDGRIVTRNIAIPESIDPALMDRIVGREEFTDGVYHMKDVIGLKNDAIMKNPKTRLRVSVSTDFGLEETREDIVDAFMAAYTKDVAEHYDFTLASNNNPSGSVSLYDNNYFNISWPVYESYDDTIAFLKEKGLWKGGLVTPSDIKKIEVTKSGYDEEIEEYTSDSVEYTDATKIEELLNSSLPMTYYSAWIKYSELENEDLNMTVYLKDDPDDEDSFDRTSYRCFYKGKIPGFVNNDLP